MRNPLLALFGVCACGPALTGPMPTPPPTVAPVAASPMVFEPKLAWAEDGPDFVPASTLGVVDERNLLHSIGDGRYFGLLGVGEALPAYSMRGAASSEGLIVPNLFTRADQNVSSVASLWDRDGHFVGYFEGLAHIYDVAAATDAPLAAFALSYDVFHERGSYPFGVWLLNTRSHRFYAPHLCEGVAERVAITPSGEHVAAVCARLDETGVVPRTVDATLRVWDLRETPPKERMAVSLQEGWSPSETTLPFGARSLVISDDGALMASATEDVVRVYRVGTAEPVRSIEAGVPVQVDDGAVVVRSGEEYSELRRVQLASGSAATLATGVTAAVADGHNLFWAMGSKIAGIDGSNMRLPSVDLQPAGVVAGGWPSQPTVLGVAGLVVQHPGKVLAQVGFGPFVPVANDLSAIDYHPKLSGQPSAIEWLPDGALAMVAQYTRFRWMPGDAAVTRTQAQPRDGLFSLDSRPSEPPPWSFHACDEFPLRSDDPRCVSVGGYIVSPCTSETPARGVHAGHMIQDPEGPPRPDPPKVWSVRYTDHVEVTTWTAPRYTSCVASADASHILLSFADARLTLYTDTGEVVWEIAGIDAKEVLTYEHGQVIVSLGDGVIAWIDATKRVQRTWKAHLTDCMLRAAVHPDGKSVATSSCDEALRVWKLAP